MQAPKNKNRKKDHRTEEEVKYKSPRQAEETSGNVQARLRPCECL